MKKKKKRKFYPVTATETKVCLGGTWDFPPQLADVMEDMWVYNYGSGSTSTGFRLVRSTGTDMS